MSDNMTVFSLATEANTCRNNKDVLECLNDQTKDPNDSTLSNTERTLLYDSTNNDYAFLQAPETQVLSRDDFQFLNHHGCFVVPKRSVMDEFIRQYFRYVHPMLPMFDEREFGEIYSNDEGDNGCCIKLKTPMIVLQAILFASCSVSSICNSLTLH